MRLRNNASVAHALIALVDVFEDGPGDGRTAGAVLSRAPGDGALRVLRDVASALGLRTIGLRASVLDDDLQGLDARARSAIDSSMSGHEPTLVLIDEAHGAEPGVIRGICNHVRTSTQRQPTLVLAVCTSAAERAVAEQIAIGLGRPVEAIAIHRTVEENQRLLRLVVGAME